MRFRAIPLVCECGRKPSMFKSVGFTTEYELVIHWTCAACGKRIYAVKSLADCCRECPEGGAGSQTAVMRQSQSDAQFLRSLGICALEDELA